MTLAVSGGITVVLDSVVEASSTVRLRRSSSLYNSFTKDRVKDMSDNQSAHQNLIVIYKT